MRALPGVELPTYVVESGEDAGRIVAGEIVDLLRADGGLVLGLPTGDTPIGVYRELIRARRNGLATFARAMAFNLDDYLEARPEYVASFERWMESHLYSHVDFDRARRRIPTAREGEDPHAIARDYEASIRGAGGLGLLVLGIGRNGHIGFNEPGSERDSRTRVVDLHPVTRADAAPGFGGLERVPMRAITMGVATMLEARRIRVLAFGERKAAVVRSMLVEPQSSASPATFLRGHPDVKLFVDGGAASALTRS